MSTITIRPPREIEKPKVLPEDVMLNRIQADFASEWSTILQLLEYPEIYLSGSRVSAGILSSYQRETYSESDLDLFIVTKDSHLAALLMGKIIQSLDRQVEYAERGFVARLTREGLPPIGVNWMEKDSISDVLESFDMTHLGVAYRPGGVTTTPGFNQYMKTGVSVVTRDTIYSRVEKALSRGYPVQIGAKLQALKMDSYKDDEANRQPVCTLQEADHHPPEEIALRYRPLPPANSDVWYRAALAEGTVNAAELSLQFWAGVLLLMHPAKWVSMVYLVSGVTTILKRPDWTLADYGGKVKLLIRNEGESKTTGDDQVGESKLPVHSVTRAHRVENHVYLTVMDKSQERIIHLTRFLNHPEQFAFHTASTRPAVENGQLFFYIQTDKEIYQLDYFQFREIY